MKVIKRFKTMYQLVLHLVNTLILMVPFTDCLQFTFFLFLEAEDLVSRGRFYFKFGGLWLPSKTFKIQFRTWQSEMISRVSER